MSPLVLVPLSPPSPILQAIFESEAAREAHKGGWSGAFELLVEYAATP